MYTEKSMCETFELYLKNAPFFGGNDDTVEAAPAWYGWLGVYAPYVLRARLWLRLPPRLRVHGWFCKGCAAKKRRFLAAERLLKTAFLPPAPDCADAVMAVLLDKDTQAAKRAGDWGSFSGWIAAGVGLALSLLTVYVNGSFADIAQSRGGVSYLLALALIIGGAVTVYGALFIGSHMDALCKKFGLD
ncbi:MAG: hypothetical protein LBC72_01250 [Spirochaetaceae bacterium]|jgi:hypothetical protein|nr:hypothetical protein [Spirochaetaceae bacterium]